MCKEEITPMELIEMEMEKEYNEDSLHFLKLNARVMTQYTNQSASFSHTRKCRIYYT